MDPGTDEGKSKLIQVLKKKLARKDELILIFKQLVLEKEKSTRENVLQELCNLKSKNSHQAILLQNQIIQSFTCIKKIMEEKDIQSKTILNLSKSLEDSRATAAHLEFQLKQLVHANEQLEATIKTLKKSQKASTKNKKSGNCVTKREKKRDKSLRDPPQTSATSVSGCAETSKPSLKTNKSLKDPSQTSATSLSGCAETSKPSKTTQSEVFEEPDPPLLTPIQSATRKPLHDDLSLSNSSSRLAIPGSIFDLPDESSKMADTSPFSRSFNSSSVTFRGEKLMSFSDLRSEINSPPSANSHCKAACNLIHRQREEGDRCSMRSTAVSASQEHIVIEIKEQDALFSFKVSVPAGNPLDPILGSIRRVFLDRVSRPDSRCGFPIVDDDSESAHDPPLFSEVISPNFTDNTGSESKNTKSPSESLALRLSKVEITRLKESRHCNEVPRVFQNSRKIANHLICDIPRKPLQNTGSPVVSPEPLPTLGPRRPSAQTSSVGLSGFCLTKDHQSVPCKSNLQSIEVEPTAKKRRIQKAPGAIDSWNSASHNIEKIMAEMVHFCPAPLSPIADSPDEAIPNDFDTKC